jgi:hypothetical protein
MKKYQKRKCPPVKPRPVLSVAPVLNVAPVKVGRDSYDKSLIWTKITALAAVVACVISVVAQVSSDKVVALALKNFSQVADAGDQQAAESKRIAEATVKLASSAQLQADAALQQADSATKQAASSADQAFTSARSAVASERAIGIAAQQLNQQRLLESKRLRPLLALTEILLTKGSRDESPKISAKIENVGALPALQVQITVNIECPLFDKDCTEFQSQNRGNFNFKLGTIANSINGDLSVISDIYMEYMEKNSSRVNSLKFQKSENIFYLRGDLFYTDVYSAKNNGFLNQRDTPLYKEYVCIAVLNTRESSMNLELCDVGYDINFGKVRG